MQTIPAPASRLTCSRACTTFFAPSLPLALRSFSSKMYRWCLPVERGEQMQARRKDGRQEAEAAKHRCLQHG